MFGRKRAMVNMMMMMNIESMHQNIVKRKHFD